MSHRSPEGEARRNVQTLARRASYLRRRIQSRTATAKQVNFEQAELKALDWSINEHREKFNLMRN